MGIAVVADLWKHKIPNYLVVIIFIINLIFLGTDFVGSRVTSGEMLLRIGKLALMLIFLFPFFSVGALGAGDVKLILVTSLAINEPLLFFLSIWLIAAVIGIIKLLAAGKIKQRFKHLYLYIKSLLISGVITPYLNDSDAQNKNKMAECSVHLSLPIFVSVFINLIAA